MGYLEGFLVTMRQHRLFGGQRVTRSYSGGRVAKKHRGDDGGDDSGGTADAPIDTPGDDKASKSERFHGRHVLGRYEDGMEKCIGCELCAAVCPAKCIYVRGADNDPDNPTAPGERFGFVYEINYLRCIHCDLCVEACPTEAITESKLFEFSFTNRRDAIYTKADLLVGDDGAPQRMPWEDWRAGEDQFTSGWVRATASSGDAAFEGVVGWSGELGYGVRPPEPRDDADRVTPASSDSATSDEPVAPGEPVASDPAETVTASPPVRSDDSPKTGIGSASDQPDASTASQQHGSASDQPHGSEASQETATAAAPVRSDDDDAAGVGSASDQPDASDSEPA